MVYSRNKLHELAMVCTYQYLFFLKSENRPTPKEILNDVTNEELKDNDKFIKKLFLEVIKNTNDLVLIINDNLEDWTFERLGLIERSILLNAVAENKYLEQPKEVAIDVAIELAKKYCDESTYKLINGVLDKAL